jgi:anti-sigma-K factor RskA
VADNGKAAIVVCGLTGAPSAKTYEAWVISGKSPVPAGLFRGGSGCSPVLLTQRVPKSATVAVTLERAGGAASPTLPILFRAEAT